MVQTRTTDRRDPLCRHWLHGEQTNSRTGTAQRYPNGILNHSRLYTDRKPGWCPKHQPGIPTAVVTPVRGQQMVARVFAPRKFPKRSTGLPRQCAHWRGNGVSILDLSTVAGDYVSSLRASFLEIQSTRRQFFRRWMGCDWLTDFAPERTSSPSVPDRACRVSGSRLRTVLSME